MLQQFVWLGSNYRRCKKKAPKCPTFKRRKRSYPNYSVINIERMDGNKIFISRRVALGSLTLPTLGNSPTLPKAILRLVPGPVLLAVQARPSISRNSSPLPFVPSHSLSLCLSYNGHEKFYGRRYSYLLSSMSILDVATPTHIQRNDRPRGPEICGVSSPRCRHRGSVV